MKRMIKLMTIMFSFIMILGMTACGKKEAASGITIKDIYDQGYRLNASSLSGDVGTWKAYYIKDGDWSKPYLVEVTMTQDECSEITDADDEKAEELLSAKKDVKITDVSDKVPAQDEIDKYVGKSLKELDDEGYYVCGSTEDEDGNAIVDCTKNGEYQLKIKLNEAITWSDFNEDNVDYSTLTVKEVEFAGFNADE